MNTRKSILVLATGVLLTVSGMALAVAPQKSAPKAAAAKTAAKTVDSVTRGTIASADANQIVLADKKDSKAPGATYKINAQTVKSGDMTKGASVTVHYKKDGSDMVATSVVAAPQKEAAVAAVKATKAPAKQ